MIGHGKEEEGEQGENTRKKKELHHMNGKMNSDPNTKWPATLKKLPN